MTCGGITPLVMITISDIFSMRYVYLLFHWINGPLWSKSIMVQLILDTGKERYILDFYRQFGQLLEVLALSLAVH